MYNLNQAREWAESVSAGPATDRAHAAAKIIQSLPNQLVDVEKVKVIIADMDHCLKMESTTDFSNGIDNATTSWRDALKALITPKLPTLADMTEAERKACLWMQCKVETDDGYGIGVIRRVWASKRVDILYQSGMSLDAEYRRVTPLPDLPKLKWPGGVVDCEIVDEPETICSGSIHTPMQPSEVPANEPWLLEIDGNQCIGTRLGVATARPWSVAALNGSHAFHVDDSEITLIHKLVPETHALPEGMRLADHKECGRVVVSQRADKDGNYKVFCSISSKVTGDDWWYAHKNELTFLDGNQ